MAVENSENIVEKEEISPGQFMIIDKRYRMPKKDEKDLKAVWKGRFENIDNLVKEAKVKGVIIIRYEKEKSNK